VYADRCTGWLEISHLPHGATSSRIMVLFHQYFARWGVPEGISTDGGTNLTSDEVCKFLNKWGVVMRISSAQYAQSNGRAEAAVKSAKRLRHGKMGTRSSLDSDKVSKALLQYLNTPLREVNKSPAQLTMGRQLRDGIPVHRRYYKIDMHWQRALRTRELATARQHRNIVEQHGTPRTLVPLTPGAPVCVQNQATNVWYRRGMVAEALPNRQYSIRLDGSGRISIRNRRHLGPVRVTMATPHPTPEPVRRPKRQVTRPGWLSDFVTDTPT